MHVTNPALSARLRKLLANDTVGSPMGGLRRMRRSVARLAADGFAISASTVRRWFRSNGFSLRVNRKCLATTQHPCRDPQFQRIAALRRR